MTALRASKPFQRGLFRELPEQPRLPHAFEKMSARFVEIDSAVFGKHRVHYREHGDGEPLLLVHGLMTTNYSWRYVYADLGKKYRVIAPDLPGAGATDPCLGGKYSLENLATWVGEFQKAVGIRGTRAVGNSLGGLICMRLALDDAGAFSQLVNIHSPCFPEARYHLLHNALKVPGVKTALARVIRMNPLKWVHRNVHYYDESLKSLEEAHAFGDPLAAPSGAEAFIHYLSDVITPTATRKISRALQERCTSKTPFPCPLLLIYARTDPMVSPENGVKLAKLLPDVKMIWLENSSHFAHVDTPELIVHD
ncbi:MAG: alpha/beta hydrolase, partial [Polyangiaceae bacterium]